MNAERIIILATCVLFFLAGILSAQFLGSSLVFETGFGDYLDAIVLCIASFVFAVLLYGYAAPLFYLYFGAVSRNLVFGNPLVAIIYFEGAFAATYAGMIFSFHLKNDFNGSGNLFSHVKEFALPFIAALALSIAGAVLTPYFPTSDALAGLLAKLFA